jgi:hypothetical protein
MGDENEGEDKGEQDAIVGTVRELLPSFVIASSCPCSSSLSSSLSSLSSSLSPSLTSMSPALSSFVFIRKCTVF